MSYRDNKNSMYADAGVRKNKLKEGYHEYYFRPGFFTPYRSCFDFSNELKAPVVMPILCVAQIIIEAVDALKNVALTVVNLAALNFSQAWRHVSQASNSAVFAIYLGLSAVVDTLWSIVSLMTRTLASIASLIGTTLKAAIDCCTPDSAPETIVYLPAEYSGEKSMPTYVSPTLFGDYQSAPSDASPWGFIPR